MPSIKITELDLTTPGDISTNTNIVYIPGFMTTNSDGWDLDIDGESLSKKAAKSLTPTLCQSIYEFEAYFGKKPFMTTPGEGSGEKSEMDMSYLYAKELLNLGVPVLYESLNSINDETKLEITTKDALVSKMTDAISNGLYDKLLDRGAYRFKYLTSGAYPTFTISEDKKSADASIAAKLLVVAKERGDCMVLVDIESAPDVTITELHKLVCTQLKNNPDIEFGAVFAPWVNIDCVTHKPSQGDKNITFSMPGSYAYLSALGKSLQTNDSWLAVAGVARGQIPNLNGKNPLEINYTLTNSMAEGVQNRGKDEALPLSINAITNISPFGYRIWGNRTLKNNVTDGNLTATSFLNIRNMICDVKKVVYEACRKYTFEQNNDVLWLNFKSYIEPTLNKMKTGAGLSGYKIVKGTTNEKAKLVATIKLYPLYAVEDFEITVQMLDDEISVS